MNERLIDDDETLEDAATVGYHEFDIKEGEMLYFNIDNKNERPI